MTKNSKTTAKRTTKPVAKKAAPKTNGAFAGKKLYPAAGVKTNPRKPGTGGHKAFAIILANPGIAYEDYRKKGGGRQHVAWDLERNWVTLR